MRTAWLAKFLAAFFLGVTFDHFLLPRSAESGGGVAPPRVLVACLATGRYLSLGQTAIRTAHDHFGGDARMQFLLLTDDPAQAAVGLPPAIEIMYTPYREWPLSGLRKFHDLLVAVGPRLGQQQTMDYFYFLDADTVVLEAVTLVDVGGDLVGVEHPMYPHAAVGFCGSDVLPTCDFPLDRDPRSRAYVPPWFKKEVLADGRVLANTIYLQSAFWGGKARVVSAMLNELAPLVEADLRDGILNPYLQDERYLNYYFWKHANDSDVNIRILKPSFLWPEQTLHYGPWLLNHSRPIIVHVAKAAQRLFAHEISLQVKVGRQRVCVDHGLGVAAGAHVATHKCHGKGGSQGFLFDRVKGEFRIPGTHLCIDAAGVREAGAVVLAACPPGQSNTSVDRAQLARSWTHEVPTGHLVNALSGLCLDVHRRHAQRAQQAASVMYVEECDASEADQRFDLVPVTKVHRNAQT